MSNYDEMNQALKEQKDFFIKNGAPSIELRIDRLQRLKSLIMDNRYDFVDALNADFGNRSKNVSMLSDVYGIMPAINLAIKNVKKWNKVEKKSSNFPFGLLGAKSYVKYEPLGTVGMISPWNFPVNLAFVPLVSIFAAGNQIMHKPSEYTEQTSLLLKELCDSAFDEDEFATILGGPDVGASFTQQKFDHLLYTGSGTVAKHRYIPRDTDTGATFQTGSIETTCATSQNDTFYRRYKFQACTIQIHSRICQTDNMEVYKKFQATYIAYQWQRKNGHSIKSFWGRETESP